MAEEWRLSIDFTGHSGTGQRFYRGREAREVLRSRFGDDIVISAGKRRIFLYAENAGVAREAGLAARQALAQQGLSADVRLDRWDPSGKAWRAAQASEPEQDAAPLAGDPGSPGHADMSPAMAEALATVIVGVLDLIRIP
jgi:hypothetical protein